MKPAARHKARKFALQAIYQWQMTNQAPEEIKQQFEIHENLSKADLGLFYEFLENVPEKKALLDAAFADLLDRKIDELGPIELAILRLGTYELTYRFDIPHQVIIHEWLSLARDYGAQGSFKYVNGVLDKLAKRIRPIPSRSKT